MPNRSRKKPDPDFNQIARSIVDRATGTETMPAAKKPAAKSPRPKNKQDAADLDRANSEGMGQPQEQVPKRKRVKKKDPAAVALGRKGGLKGGKARAAKLTAEQRAASARKAAKARWTNRETN